MPDPTEDERRCITNAVRSAELITEAVKGQLRTAHDLLTAHNWRSNARGAAEALKEFALQLDILHRNINDEAIDKGVTVPDEGVIQPLSGGGGKGGGG